MCSICYGEDNERSIVTSCGHAFHINCLTKWWETKEGDANCPMCRYYHDTEEFDYVWTRHFAFMYVKKKREGEKQFTKWIGLLKHFLNVYQVPLEDVLNAREFVPLSIRPCEY